MSDHVVLYVDGLERHDAEASSSCAAAPMRAGDTEEQPLIHMGECRICQEEDCIQNLETPCACSGSLKYAHRKCVQHWCDEKGDTVCEICHQLFHPNYTAPPPLPERENATLDIGGGWTISGTPLDLRDPRLIAIAETERHFLDAEYDEYTSSNANGSAFCRSAALILMALLLLRHALTIPDEDGEDDVSVYFSVTKTLSNFQLNFTASPSPIVCLAWEKRHCDGLLRCQLRFYCYLQLFLLRAAGFLLPCYIMAWAISILQRRRQRQEVSALAARRVAFVLQAGQRQGVHFAIAPTMAPASPVAAHQEPV